MGKRSCRLCGCTDRDACWSEETGACWWVEPDLCSACSGDQPGASRDAPLDIVAEGYEGDAPADGDVMPARYLTDEQRAIADALDKVLDPHEVCDGFKAMMSIMAGTLCLIGEDEDRILSAAAEIGLMLVELTAAGLGGAYTVVERPLQAGRVVS